MFLRNKKLPILFLVLLLFSLRLLFIGDSAFINDEPFFVGLGYESLRSGDWMQYGLTGRMGLQYGPYTAWFFGALLYFSYNLITVTVLKVILVSFLFLVASFWFWRLFKDNFSPLFILPVWLSSFFWYYSRSLWDLSPGLVFLSFVGYLAFIKEKKAWQLFLATVFIVLACLTHLMCLPLALAMLIHFILFFSKEWVPKNWKKFSLIVLSSIVLGGHYFLYLLTHIHLFFDSTNLPFRASSLAHPFLLARFFTLDRFSYFLGSSWQFASGLPTTLNSILVVVQQITLLGYLASFVGIFFSVSLLISAAKKRNISKNILFHGAFLSIVILLLQIVFSIKAGIYSHPHYYNGVWVAGFFFFAFGWSKVWRYKATKIFFTLYCLSMLLGLVHIIATTHINRGMRYLHYGTTLRNQMEIAHNLNNYAPETQIVVRSEQQTVFPQALMFLRILDREMFGLYPSRSTDKATIDYCRRDDKYDAQICIYEDAQENN